MAGTGGRWARLGKLMFGRYLLLTNTASCGGLLGIGDLATQSLEKWAGVKDKYDWKRTARLCALGTVLGPLNHVWYSALDKFLVGKATTTVAKKILLDQLIGSPMFAFTFFMGVGTLEQQSLETSFGEFREKFWQVYMADWMLWPAAQFINFKLLDPRFRVLYVASVTCVWNSFLSFMKHKDQWERAQIEQGVELAPASHPVTEEKQDGTYTKAVARPKILQQ